MSGDATGSTTGSWKATGLCIVIACTFLLCFAPPSDASLGVEAFWGNIEGNSGDAPEGGRFGKEAPSGVAIYEQTGDVYVADTEWNRVQQFNSNGAFIRAWGFDVEAPSASPESSATFEICTSKPQCKKGVASGTGLGGKLFSPAGIAVNQTNGHVYVRDIGFNRIQEFTASGVFVRAFGQEVVSAGPDNTGGYEICVAANGDVCQAGVSSGATGGVFNQSGYLAIAPAGAPNQTNVLVADSRYARVQEFTATGGFVRAFGWDVVQPGGSGGSGINERQEITLSPELAGGTFTLSFSTTAPTTTAALPANASSSEVEAALAGLGGIAGAANIDVSGPVGGPWTVEFTGTLADRDVEAIKVAAATVALGTQISCSSTTTADNTSFRWLRNGTPITGANSATYTTNASSTTTPVTTTGDAGATIQCQVTKSSSAVNGAGSTQISNPAGIVATPSGSPPTAPPGAITSPAAPVGGFNAGNKLKCTTGTWTGVTLPFAFQWYRNGVALIGNGANTNEYTLQAGDLSTAAAFQCAITGSNANGSVTKVSGNRITAAPAPPPSSAPPGGNTGSPNVSAPLPGGTAVALPQGSRAFEVCVIALQCQEGVIGSGVGQFAENDLSRIAEDPAGNIYTVESTVNFRVQKFIQSGLGNVPTPQGVVDCADLCGTNSETSPTEIAADDQGFIYVAKAFLIGQGNPPVIGPPPKPLSGNSQERVLKIDPAANGGNGALVTTMLANTGIEPNVEGGVGQVVIVGISGLTAKASGSRLYFATAFSKGIGGQSRAFRLGAISGPSGSISTGAVGATAATLNATIEPAQTLGFVKTFYRFEYRRAGTTAWVPSQSADINIGNGSAGGVSDECAPQLEAATCHVSGQIDGLEVGRTYEYRLFARTSYQGSVFTTAPQEFTTVPVPPAVETGGAVWGGPPSENPSLTFSGRINPQGGDTNYTFEYVSQADFEVSEFAKAQTAPAVPISAGHGSKTLDVVVSKNGLDASSAYRFRLVATNVAGTSTGDERLVDASHAGDRFIELVSEGDSGGADVSEATPMVTVSDDGERAAFGALTFGDDQQAAPWINAPVIAQRKENGWTTTAVLGDPFGDASGGLANTGSVGNAAVTQRLWGVAPEAQTVQWAVRSLDGTLAPISPVLSPLDRSGDFSLAFQGGSNDLSTLVLSGGPLGKSTLFPGEPLLTGTASNLYKISGAGTVNPKVSLLNRADGGGVIGGACGASLGSVSGPRTNAVSADGSAIYFSARAGAPTTGSCNTGVPVRIFKRIGDASATEISACAKTLPATCASIGDDLYWGASADGSKAFFTTSRSLTDSDTDSTGDLYIYDESLPASERLIQASAGEAVGGHTVGSGADVQGVVDFAMDGSRVYFVAKGVLAAGGSVASNNLYVFERDDAHPAGRIHFVATLAPGVPTPAGISDPRLWISIASGTGGFKPAYALPRYEGGGSARVGGDGHLLLFISDRPLLPAEDLDTFNDLYRYDDDTGQMACLSCIKDGSFRASIIGHNIGSVRPDLIQGERVASEDGSKAVFFTTERLLAADTNDVADAYLWDDGTLSLVSGATATAGTPDAEGGGPAISPDGRTVFFATRATLLPQDLDNGALDIYAARVDGGFHQEDVAVACASEDACRSVIPARPPQTQSPGSVGFGGKGNVKAKKCSKKKVLRGGKCVLKHRGKHKSDKGKKQDRAGSGRRAGR